MFFVGLISISFVLYTDNIDSSQKKTVQTRAEVPRDTATYWNLSRTKKAGMEFVIAKRIPKSDSVGLLYVDSQDRMQSEIIRLDKDDFGISGFLINPLSIKQFSFSDKNVKPENMKTTDDFLAVWSLGNKYLGNTHTPWLIRTGN